MTSTAFNTLRFYAGWIILSEEKWKSLKEHIPFPVQIFTQKRLRKKQKDGLSFKPGHIQVLILDDQSDTIRLDLPRLSREFFVPVFHAHLPLIVVDSNGVLTSVTIPENWLGSSPGEIDLQKVEDWLWLEQISALYHIRRMATDRSTGFPEIPSWIKEKMSRNRQFFINTQGMVILREGTEEFKILPDWIFPSTHQEINYWTSGRAAFHRSGTGVFPEIHTMGDREQAQAATRGDGSALIAAPAGSGKTRTLMMRILYLAHHRKIPPDRILALAFNKKAAEEMKNRLQSLGVHGVRVSTFHSFGYHLIRRHFKGWTFDEGEENYRRYQLIVKAVNEHYHLRFGMEDDLYRKISEGIRKIKEELKDPGEIRLEAEETLLDMKDIFRSLLKLQKQEKVFFYEDMVFFALLLLLNRPKLRRKIQNAYLHLLVDEFQDLNASQLLMVRILASPTMNLTVFGDDDQLIYAWRGAQIESILNIQQWLGLTEVIVLKRNYRSPMNIVWTSAHLISANRRRIKKEIQSVRPFMAGSFRIFPAGRLSEETGLLVKIVQEWMREKISPSDIAVLTRYHLTSFIAAAALRQAGIHVRMAEPDAIFHSTPARDLLAYIRLFLSEGKPDKATFKRVLTRPVKYFKSSQIEQLHSVEDLENLLRSPLPEWQKEKIMDFLENFHSLNALKKLGATPDVFLDALYERFELAKLYIGDTDAEAELENVSGEYFWKYMKAFAASFSTVEEFYTNISEFSQMVSHKKGVLVSTIHRTKGNEFPCVICFHFNRSWTENGKYCDHHEEDERRVAYVGVTRALEKLAITFNRLEDHQHVLQLLGVKNGNIREIRQLKKEIGKMVKQMDKEFGDSWKSGESSMLSNPQSLLLMVENQMEKVQGNGHMKESDLFQSMIRLWEMINIQICLEKDLFN